MSVLASGQMTAADFGFAPQPEPDRLELVERKVCEGLCGGCFYRPVPANARIGEKICVACRAKLNAGGEVIPAKWDKRRGDLFNMRDLPKVS